jgi:hypothetical protein
VNYDKILIEVIMTTQNTQNITLALPKNILRRAKLVAAKRHTSVSHLLTEALEATLSEEQGYLQAQTRQSALLEKGIILGTEGIIGWRREALHER